MEEADPALPLPANFPHSREGNSAFRIILGEEIPAYLTPDVLFSRKRGVFGWWDIPSGLDLPSEKILQDRQQRSPPRTFPGIMKEGLPRSRLHPFLPSTHYGISALLPSRGIEVRFWGASPFHHRHYHFPWKRSGSPHSPPFSP